MSVSVHRLLGKEPRPGAARFLAAEEGEHDRVLRTRAEGQRLHQLEHRYGTRGIVVCAVENLVAASARWISPIAEMIDVRTQEDDALASLSAQAPHGVPGVGRDSRLRLRLERNRVTSSRRSGNRIRVRIEKHHRWRTVLGLQESRSHARRTGEKCGPTLFDDGRPRTENECALRRREILRCRIRKQHSGTWLNDRTWCPRLKSPHHAGCPGVCIDLFAVREATATNRQHRR